MEKPLEIDGSHQEGGGQILRTASALSVLTGRPIHIFNIRSNRSGGTGLKTQHLRGLEALAEFCGGKLEGGKLGSKEITFHPGEELKTGLKIQIETAGSTGLVMQSLLLAALKAKESLRVDIEGGATFAKFAPPMSYITGVLLPILRKMGYHSEILVTKHGFYPSGGAKVIAMIKPCDELKPLMLEEQGCVRDIRGISVSSKNMKQSKVAERQTRILEEVLTRYGYDCQVRNEYADTICTGSGVAIWATTTRGGILGSSEIIAYDGHTGEAIAWECIRNLEHPIKADASVDSWMSDQILPYMALAKGRSVVVAPEFTSHAETNIWVIKQFLPDVEFKITKNRRNVTIECSGS